MSVATPLSSTKIQSAGATSERASHQAARAAATSSRACSSGLSALFFPPQVEPRAGAPDGEDAEAHSGAFGVEGRELRERAVVALGHEAAQHLGASPVDFRPAAARVPLGGNSPHLAHAAAPLVNR